MSFIITLGAARLLGQLFSFIFKITYLYKKWFCVKIYKCEIFIYRTSVRYKILSLKIINYKI